MRGATAASAAAVVFACACFTGATPAAADVADYIGRPVRSVRIEAEGRILADPRLADLIETPTGQPLAMTAVRETLAHLFSLGTFEDIRVHAETEAGAVALRYELFPVHPVADIVFTIPPGTVDEGAVRRAVVERFGASPDPRRVDEAAAAVADVLRQAGFLRPSVVPRLDLRHSPEESTLVFTIAPGARTRIGTLAVRGDPAMAEAAFLSDMEVAPGRSYAPEALNGRIERYIQARRSRGYYNVGVRLTTTLVDEDRTANLLFTIDQGPRVRVTFSGDPLPADRRDELVPVAREGSADEDLLEDSSSRIVEYFRAQGYFEASAPFTRTEQNGELVVNFEVTRGVRYRVARYEISGNSFMPTAGFANRLRVREGQPFSDAALDADVAAIQELYRRAGFAAVRVESGINPEPAPEPALDVPVVVRIVITENARTVVRSVRVAGNEALGEQDLTATLGLRPGAPFYVPQLAIDREAIEIRYQNLGFRSATVASSPGFSSDGSAADIVFTVQEGPRIFVDHVLIVGNVRTRSETIQRELAFKRGFPLGLGDVTESQRRLAALGLFRRTRITELRHGEETRRDVLVAVEEAPVSTIGFGGGLEAGTRQTESASAEEVELAPRAFFEIGRRNLFGKNRSINLFTRVSVRTGGSGFNEYRVLGTFREPRVLNTTADAFLTGTVEQQRRTSFNFSRRAFSAEAARPVRRNLSVSGNYQIQRTELFDVNLNEEEKLLIDRLFPQIVLSSFSLSGIHSTRDDPVNPSDGVYFSANGQLAGRRIGSEVGFAKTYLTAQLFRTLPSAVAPVFAASARLGVAAGFPREVVVVDPAGQPAVSVVRDLPASERFFAGGDTTVRGFALDQLGTAETIDQTTGFPIGGNALVIFNAELRVPVRGGFGVVGFVDTGNVFAHTGDVDLTELRSAMGFGVRYRSPVGPIRVDIGFKLKRRNIPGSDRRETPSAFHISLGQAF